MEEVTKQELIEKILEDFRNDLECNYSEAELKDRWFGLSGEEVTVKKD